MAKHLESQLLGDKLKTPHLINPKKARKYIKHLPTENMREVMGRYIKKEDDPLLHALPHLCEDLIVDKMSREYRTDTVIGYL